MPKTRRKQSLRTPNQVGFPANLEHVCLWTARSLAPFFSKLALLVEVNKLFVEETFHVSRWMTLFAFLCSSGKALRQLQFQFLPSLAFSACAFCGRLLTHAEGKDSKALRTSFLGWAALLLCLNMRAKIYIISNMSIILGRPRKFNFPKCSKALVRTHPSASSMCIWSCSLHRQEVVSCCLRLEWLDQSHWRPLPKAHPRGIERQKGDRSRACGRVQKTMTYRNLQWRDSTLWHNALRFHFQDLENLACDWGQTEIQCWVCDMGVRTCRPRKIYRI